MTRSAPVALAAMVVFTLVASDPAAAGERKWQTGTWLSTGIKRDAWVAGAPGSPGIGAAPSAMQRTEVAVYVIDTPELRLELQDIVPIGSSRLEEDLKMGAPVTFALEKNSVYVRGRRGVEYRLRVTKKVIKPAK
jgi:hypothetical protein